MKFDRTKKNGQALIEFVFSLVIGTPFLGLVGFLIWSQWNRAKCAYLVFDAVHSQLIGQTRLHRPRFIEVGEDEISVFGIGRCGQAFERVRLPKLESAKWKREG